MNIALISLIVLVMAIAIGYFMKLNTGIVSIGFAFLIGTFLVGLEAKQIIGGWPLKLFFVLLGMTFLFSIAGVNGTLKLVAQKVIYVTGGNRKLIPIAFFVMSGILAAIGPGNIAICALILPIAMAVSSEEKISPLLMATMVIAGANAGGLSPIAPTGIIGVTLAKEQGLNIGMQVFLKQIIGQSILAVILYFFLKGHRLKSNKGTLHIPSSFNKKQNITIGVILLVVIGIIFGRWNIGLSAFLGAAILLVLRTANEDEAIASIPWSTLILVCGVGMLVNVCRESGGIELLTEILSTFMNKQTVGPVMALTGGVMSIVSSASGVVMPTLIPTVSKLVIKIGGSPTTVISAIIMGAHVVTNSPLSTLGALAVASAGKEVNKEALFRGLLILAILGLVYAACIVYIGIV